MKDIPGYEGLYAVTSCGRVWSYRRKCFLKGQKNTKGYLQVKLYKNGNRKFFMVHKLVAQAFILNTENLQQVNHKDEDKSHNYVKNLEWCTCEYNNNYGTRNKRISEKHSKKCKCIETNKIYSSVKAAAKEFNCDESSTSKVCRGKRNSVCGFHFIYI